MSGPYPAWMGNFDYPTRPSPDCPGCGNPKGLASVMPHFREVARDSDGQPLGVLEWACDVCSFIKVTPTAIQREARAEPDAEALRAEIARLERQLQKCEEGPWG